MTTYGVTAEGFVVKRLADVRTELENSFRAAFGLDIVTDAEGAYGRLIGILADREAAVWELAQECYDARTVEGADDQALDDICSLVGVTREPATSSTVTVTITGTPGTVVSPTFTLRVPGYDDRFDLDTAVTIGVGGTVDGEFTAQDTGPIYATAGTLTEIVTPVAGVTSVTNALDAEPGTDEESDVDLRSRRADAIAVIGSGTVDAIAARVAAEVDDVTTCTVTENDTDFTDANGLPPHSIHAVVMGGDSTAIAEKIWDTKPGGIRTWGDSALSGFESIDVTDDQGYDHTVEFNYAEQIPTFHALYITAGEVEWPVGVAQTFTITVLDDADGSGVVHTATINGQAYTYTTPSAKTKAEIATALGGVIGNYAWNGSAPPTTPPTGTDAPLFCTVSVTDEVITCTGWALGYSHSVTVTATLSTEETVAASGIEKQIIEKIAELGEVNAVIGEDFPPSSCIPWAMEADDLVHKTKIIPYSYRSWSTAYAALIGTPVQTTVSIGISDIADFDTTRILVRVA